MRRDKELREMKYGVHCMSKKGTVERFERKGDVNEKE
jgi:hypothetical protein